MNRERKACSCSLWPAKLLLEVGIKREQQRGSPNSSAVPSIKQPAQLETESSLSELTSPCPLEEDATKISESRGRFSLLAPLPHIFLWLLLHPILAVLFRSLGSHPKNALFLPNPYRHIRSWFSLQTTLCIPDSTIFERNGREKDSNHYLFKLRKIHVDIKATQLIFCSGSLC